MKTTRNQRMSQRIDKWNWDVWINEVEEHLNESGMENFEERGEVIGGGRTTQTLLGTFLWCTRV